MNKKLLTLSLLLIVTHALDMYVDSTISAISGNKVPTLQQALDQIYNHSNDPQNSVTLLSNTIGIDQVITNLSVIDPRPLNITYGNFTTLPSDVSACNVTLPTILINDTSQFSVNYLSSLLIEGVYLKALFVKQSANISNVVNFTLSNSCLEDNQAFLVADNHYTFQVFDLVNTVLSSVLYLQMSSQLINIEGSQIVSINDLKISLTQNIAYQNMFRILGTNVAAPKLSISIQNIQITCLGTVNQIESIFVSYYASVFQLSNLSLQNCFMNLSPSQLDSGATWRFFIYAMFGDMVLIENINVSNLSMVMSDFYTFGVIGCYGAKSIEISNVSLEMVNYVGLLEQEGPCFVLIFVWYLKPDFNYGFPIVMTNADIRNVVVSNSNFTGGSDLIVVQDPTMYSFQSFSAENIVVSNCKFYFVTAFKITPYPSDEYTVQKPQLYSFKNLTIQNSFVNETCLFVILNSYITIYPFEPYILELDGVNFTNNNFTGTGIYNPILVVATQLRLLNFIYVNNTLENILFVGLLVRVSSFVLTNAVVSNLSLSSAQLFGYSLESSLQFYIGTGFYNNSQVQVEFRPFLVINATFSNITLQNNSVLITSNNPSAVIGNSSFTQISSNGSTILGFGEFSPSIYSNSYFSSPDVEGLVFLNLAQVQQYYNNYRSTVSNLSITGNTVFYFVILQDVLFDTVSSVNFTDIVSVTDKTVNASVVCILNSSFTNIISLTSQTFSMISLDQVDQFIIQNSIIQQISGDGGLIGVVSTSSDYLLFDSNVITSTINITGITLVVSLCGPIKYVNNSATSVATPYAWTEISCGAMQPSDAEIFINNSSFSNISLVALPSELNSPIFLNIQIISNLINVINTSLIIINSSFSNISIDKTAQQYSLDMFNTPVMQLAVSGSNILLQDSIFNDLANTPSDNIMIITAVELTVSNCSFLNLNHSASTGAIYTVLSQININGSSFEGNRGNGVAECGLITITNPSLTDNITIAIENSIFARNYAPETSLIKIQNSSLIFSLTNSVIADNFAQTNGAFLIESVSTSVSVLTFSNVTFSLSHPLNMTGYKSDILYVANSTGSIKINMENVSLNVRGNTSGNLITSLGNSNISLSVYNFFYNSTDMGELYQMQIDTGNLDVYLNSYSDDSQSFGILNADSITAQFQQIYVSGLALNNTALFQLSCTQVQSAFFYSSLDISSSSFTNLSLTSSMLIWLTSTTFNSTQLCGVSVSVENSDFSVISSAVSDGAIFRLDSSQFVGMGPNKALVSLVQSRFKTISSQRGSIYFGRALKGPSSILFDRCEFTGIEASQEGGVFYVTNASNGSYSTTPSTNSQRIRRALGSIPTTQNYMLENYNIFNCNFSTISAQNGGVFYGDYPNNGNSTIILQNNSFYNIQSVSRGGILFVYDSNLQIQNNNFTNISALITGSIVYSYAAKLNPSNLQASNNLNFVNDPSPSAFAPNTLQIQLQSTGFAQASYEQDPTTSNTYLVLTNTSSFSLENLTLSITLYYHNGQISQALTDNTLIGSVNLAFTLGNSQTKNFPSPCLGSVCTVQPSTINLVGNEGFITDVTVTYISQNVNYMPSTQFQIVLRGCVIGEVNGTVGLACTVCESGKYSLNPSDKVCKTCLEYTTCYGGSSISLHQGYWRRHNKSENIIECKGGVQRCNGGFDSSCTEQYTGPVCLQCNTALGYIADKGDCSLCSDENYIVGFGVSVLVISFAYQIYVFYSTYRDNDKTYKEHQTPAADSSENSTPKPGAYITILTTYAQVSSLFSKWIVDGVISNTFDFSITLGNPNQQIWFSLQCFLFYTMQDPFEILRLKVVIFNLSPLLKLTIISLFLVIRAVVTKEEDKKKRLQKRIGVVVVGLITLEQPGIVGVLCDYLSCITLDPSDETVYVAINPNVQCGTDDYNFFRNFFVIPAIFTWGFLIPMTLFWILHSKRKKLVESEIFYVIFGVLFSSCVPKAYYWGMITANFKFLLYFLDSLLASSSLARVLVIILVIHIYHMAYLRVSPHIYPDLTKANGYIIRSFKWSIILFLLRNAATETSTQVLTDVFIIIVNALPVGYIIFRLLAIYLSMYAAKIYNRLKKCLKRSIEEKSPKKEEPLPINSDMIVLSVVDARYPIELKSEFNHFTHEELHRKVSKDAELKMELKNVESESNLESVRALNEHYAGSPENDMDVLDLVLRSSPSKFNESASIPICDQIISVRGEDD